MGKRVSYRQGTKEKYLSQKDKRDSALYFLHDSKEIYKGDDVYTDSLRTVENFAALPTFQKAADGKLYFTEDTGNGYVMNDSRTAWVQVVHGVDGKTIGIDKDGQLALTGIPMNLIKGIVDKTNCLPEYTEADEGKILGIVGGEVAWVSK